MRNIILGVVLAFSISACVTTPEEAPLELTQGNGAAAMDFTVTAVGIDNLFVMKLSAINPVTNRIAEKQPEQLELIPIRYAAKALQTDFQLMVRELPPGEYIIEEIGIDPNQGSKPLLLALLSEVAVMANSERLYRTAKFTDASRSVLHNAPRFTIKAGVVTYLGNMIFAANTKRLEVPRKDPNGYWDGQSTDLVWDAEVFTTYATDTGGVSRHARRLNLAKNSTETTLFPQLVGEQFILKNYEHTEDHIYTTNEYRFGE